VSCADIGHCLSEVGRSTNDGGSTNQIRPNSRSVPPEEIDSKPFPAFYMAKSGTYVTQVSATGPLGLENIDPTHDPRNQ